MPVAFEGIFSRANTEDTVSRATTPTTMPECTDAPAQSFGSKRPRKETGDVLANIQNANIRKATPGGNIDAVRFEGGSQESVAKRTRRTPWAISVLIHRPRRRNSNYPVDNSC